MGHILEGNCPVAEETTLGVMLRIVPRGEGGGGGGGDELHVHVMCSCECGLVCKRVAINMYMHIHFCIG